ncbi:hypothetical protein JB92DRAFT_560560 [Gautieria morchelliformis]|nr:hypothetical protein JB92DRAFT_560560 [Gautieria morchelliformis]
MQTMQQIRRHICVPYPRLPSRSASSSQPRPSSRPSLSVPLIEGHCVPAHCRCRQHPDRFARRRGEYPSQPDGTTSCTGSGKPPGRPSVPASHSRHQLHWPERASLAMPNMQPEHASPASPTNIPPRPAPSQPHIHPPPAPSYIPLRTPPSQPHVRICVRVHVRPCGRTMRAEASPSQPRTQRVARKNNQRAHPRAGSRAHVHVHVHVHFYLHVLPLLPHRSHAPCARRWRVRRITCNRYTWLVDSPRLSPQGSTSRYSSFVRPSAPDP